MDTVKQPSNSLERFTKAQERMYQYAVSEMKDGEKQGHWMWFIFPQIKGLGRSDTAMYYAIQSLDEAKEYLQHPILGARLIECCQILIGIEGKTASDIFDYIDALKLKSSMTLFQAASPNPIFQQVLDKYYSGQKDEKT
jgi:uncharacterized protein (DUF1810 family)